MHEFEQVIEQIRAFRDQRDWMQFHNPKDMAAAIALEVAELQQIFLWKTSEEVEQTTVQKRDQIEEEVADIAIFLLEFVDNLKIDLPAVIQAKLESNALKYPVEKSKGSHAKYNEL